MITSQEFFPKSYSGYHNKIESKINRSKMALSLLEKNEIQMKRTFF